MKKVKLEEVAGMTFPAGRTTRVLTGANLLPTKNFTIGYVIIEPGGRIPLHTHSNEEVYMLLQGKGKITVGSEEEPVEAVSAVYLEPHIQHSLHNTSDGKMIMVFAYSPAGVVDHWSEEMEGKLK